MKSIYRTVIILSLIISSLYITWPVISAYINDDKIILHFSFKTIYPLVLLILAYIGLLLYLNLARILFTLLIVVNIFIPAFGMRYGEDNIEMILGNLICVGDGLIIGLSWFSEISTMFKTKKQE
jgi:hypothetical protein